MTSKEALKIISYDILDEKPVFNNEEHLEAYNQIKTELDRIPELEEEVYRLSRIIKKYQEAINDIAAKTPAPPLFSGYVYGERPDLNKYIDSLLNYISELSNTDNIIISAVYERLKNEAQKDSVLDTEK